MHSRQPGCQRFAGYAIFDNPFVGYACVLSKFIIMEIVIYLITNLAVSEL
jgi:hypothetical protein